MVIMSIPAALSWSVYYVPNRDDEGSIQSLFERSWEALATRMASHLSNTVKLTETVCGNMFGSMMLVLGPPVECRCSITASRVIPTMEDSLSSLPREA